MGAGRRFLELIDGDLRKREVAAVVLLTDRRGASLPLLSKEWIHRTGRTGTLCETFEMILGMPEGGSRFKRAPRLVCVFRG